MAYKATPITKKASTFKANAALISGAGYASSKFTDLAGPAKAGFDSATGAYDDAEKSKKVAAKAAKAEEREAASKVITSDGFGARGGAKPVLIQDIDVIDESDLEFEDLINE